MDYFNWIPICLLDKENHNNCLDERKWKITKGYFVRVRWSLVSSLQYRDKILYHKNNYILKGFKTIHIVVERNLIESKTFTCK